MMNALEFGPTQSSNLCEWQGRVYHLLLCGRSALVLTSCVPESRQPLTDSLLLSK